MALYLRNDIASSAEELATYSNGTVELLAVYSQKENLLIATVYRQPDDEANGRPSNNNQLKYAITTLQKAILNLEQTPDVIIGGDFNLPHAAWPECTPKDGCTWKEAEMISTMQSLCNEIMLTQIVSTSTHYQGNVLDLIFTNNDSLIHNYTTTPTLRSISHHHIVRAYTQYKSPQLPDEENPHPRLSPLDNYNFHSKDTDWESLETTLQNINWQSLLNHQTPEEALDTLYHQILQAVQQHVPERSRRSTNISRTKRERYNLMRRRRRINKQLRRITSPSRKEALHRELIQIEIKLYKLQERSASYQEKKAIEAIQDNIKFFYSYAKKKRKIRTNIGPLLNKSSNKMTTVSQEMAEILADQYDSVFSTPMSVSSTNEEQTDGPTLSNITATPEELESAIKELRITAATGPDGIPAILLVKCAKPLSIPLALFWNKSMQGGKIPISLLFSMITPIHKGKTKSDPANYRPVALTSHLIKVYEKVLRNHITEHIDTINGFNEHQHGFRKGRSCLTQLLAHHDNVISMLEEGSNVDVIYLDFAKAFDKVDHNIVLNKIQQLGIRGKLLKWISEFLSENRMQSVIVNGRLSTKRPVTSGVPQGSVIGPLLFLILISDIDEKTLHSIVASFADDTRATKGIQTENDAVDLQNDLFCIYQWAAANNMQFNSLKFELLRYGKDTNLKQETSYVSPEWNTIEEKEHVKDLGVTLSPDATFKQHITNIIESAKRMSGWILRTFKTRDQLTMMTLYKSLVRPIIEYASVLWTPIAKGEIQRIEEIQRSFIRKIRGINPNYHQALKQLNLYSLERRRERYTILQVWKMLEHHTPNLSNTPSSSLQVARSIEDRGGRTLTVPNLNITPGYLRKIKQQTVKVHGAKLFNSLPKHIRNTTNSTVEHFKSKLDKFLQSVEDLPLLQSGVNNDRASGSNHIFDSTPSLNNSEPAYYGDTNNSLPGETLSRRRRSEVLAISGI